MFVKVRSFKLASYNTSMLYKRAFRKEKEVITFLMQIGMSLGSIIECQSMRKLCAECL